MAWGVSESHTKPSTVRDRQHGGPGLPNADIIETVNARNLWEFLEVKTVFANWIERRIQEYGFIEDKDFFPFLEKITEGAGRPSKEYDITILMAKELSMIRKVKKYCRFNRC